MSLYLEKARELGNLILESEEAKNVADANHEYQNDKEAVEKMKEYQDLYAKVQSDMKEQKLNQEEVGTLSKKLSEMASEIKGMPSMAALIYAENEFNAFVSNVMAVLQSTITGQEMPEGGCSSGGCSSCGGGCAR